MKPFVKLELHSFHPENSLRVSLKQDEDEDDDDDLLDDLLDVNDEGNLQTMRDRAWKFSPCLFVKVASSRGSFGSSPSRMSFTWGDNYCYDYDNYYHDNDNFDHDNNGFRTSFTFDEYVFNDFCQIRQAAMWSFGSSDIFEPLRQNKKQVFPQT